MTAASFRAGALAAVALLSVGCAKHTSLRVLEPATVALPSDVQVIGVIDRSSANNVGQSILGALEGVLTGEQLSADVRGREAAIDALVLALQESPRFEVVRADAGGRRNDGLFDEELDHRLVKRICREIGCDALVALESFDSDRQLQLQGVSVPNLTNLQGLKDAVGSIDGNDLNASSRVNVMASWRTYDADQDRVLDELRDRDQTYSWQGSGSLTDLQRALPTLDNSVPTAAAEAGNEYAARIAPTWQWVTRRYFGSGDPKLREAKRYVEAGDWDGAMRLWHALESSPERRVRGKARFNLALAHEAQGDLDEALAMARQASVDLSNGTSRDYVFALEQRQRDEVRLAAQMEVVDAPAVADATPSDDEAPHKVRPSGSGRQRPTSTGTQNRPSAGMTRPR